jgi:4-amino-4-deoxy-L-arabinose transferase-like glycosyltransferase
MKREHAVLILATVLFLWFLWGHDLWAPDEPRFGEVAREMLVDGHWVVPHANGAVYNHKPPLLFWLIALLSTPLGRVLEFTCRLPSALAALGTLALTMRIGNRYYGPRTAALAGVILATSFMFWDKARWCQIDALFCSLIWAALAAFVAFREGELGGRAAGLLFWIAAAFAVLAKGPHGLLIPLGIVVITLILDGEAGRLRELAPLLGPLAFVAIVGAWVLSTIVLGPEDYSVWGAVREHFVDRGIRGMYHKQPAWYYAERLPVSLLPWTGLLPGAAVLAWRRRRVGGDRFLLVAAVFVVLFFTISTEKRDLYVLPSFPAWALLMAAAVGSSCRWGESQAAGSKPLDHRWISVGQGIIGGLLILMGIAALFVTDHFDPPPVWMAMTIAGVFFLTGVATLWTAVRKRILGSVVSLAAGIGIAYLAVVALVYPTLDSVKSARAFALRVKTVTAESRSAGERVAAYEIVKLTDPIAFYSDGVYTVVMDDPAELARHLERTAPVFAVADGSKLDRLPVPVLDRVVVIERARLSRLDLWLISNAPHPEGVPYATLRPTATPESSKILPGNEHDDRPTRREAT